MAFEFTYNATLTERRGIFLLNNSDKWNWDRDFQSKEQVDDKRTVLSAVIPWHFNEVN